MISSPRASHVSRSSLSIALLLLLTLVVAGCGGVSSAGSSGTDIDPATFAPAASALYISANLQPDGDLKANVERVGGALLRTQNLKGEIDKLLSKSNSPADKVDFRKDIEPWLAGRIGLAASSLSGTGDVGRNLLLIAPSKDDAKAKAALAKQVPAGASATYREVSYRRKPDGSEAAALVDHVVLFGSEQNVKQAIDAAKGTSLAESAAYTRAVGKLPADALGTGYLDIRGLLAGIGSAAGQPGASGIFGSILPKDVAGIGLGLYADADAVRLEVALPGTAAAAEQVAGSDAATAVAASPQDAWLALGLGDVGKSLSGLLDTLAGSGGLGGVGAGAILGQAQGAIGLDIRKDLLAWMGSASIFVSGTAKDTVGGALVVHSKDPAASRRAVEQLAKSLPRLAGGRRFDKLTISGATGFSIPVSASIRLSMAAQDDTFVIAVGDRALKAALAKGSRLGERTEFKAIAAKLTGGAKPSFYLDLRQVAELVTSLSGSDAQAAQAVDVLRRFTQLAAGGSSADDVSRATIVAGVQTK